MRCSLKSLVLLLVLLSFQAQPLAGPPIVMDNGAGASRLQGLMLLLAMENLKRRPMAHDTTEGEPASDLHPDPNRLMGIAQLEQGIARSVYQAETFN